MRMRRAWLLGALLLGCGDGEKQAEEEGSLHRQAPTADELGKSIDVADGYTRYYSSIQQVPPGGSLNLVEWVAPALERDMDVLSSKGGQTLGGHHVSLNASTVVEDPGIVRDYVNEDQLTSQLVGVAGDVGEDTIGLDLPENFVFRIYAGSGLYLQTHYINLTEETLEVRSYIDVELVEPSDDHTVLTLFTNATVDNRLPAASPHSHTNECVTQEDVALLMFANHMHEFGRSVRTEALLPDGSTMLVKEDPVWNEDWQLDINYAYRFDDPVVIPKGSTLRTRCEWDNTTDRELGFPDEMCIFLGYQAREGSVSCRDGQWIVRAAGGGSSFEDPVVGVGDGECSSDEQIDAVNSVREACMGLPRMDIVDCGLPLLQGDSACIVECFEEGGATNACGQCFGDLLVCNAEHCGTFCQSDPQGDECTECQATECCPAFEGCSGLGC